MARSSSGKPIGQGGHRVMPAHASRIGDSALIAMALNVHHISADSPLDDGPRYGNEPRTC